MLLECAGSVRTCACRVSQALKSLGHNSPIPGHFLVCARRVCWLINSLRMRVRKAVSHWARRVCRLTNDLCMRVRKAVSHWCTPGFHAVFMILSCHLSVIKSCSTAIFTQIWLYNTVLHFLLCFVGFPRSQLYGNN